METFIMRCAVLVVSFTAGPVLANECSSDYGCCTGEVCVKERFSSSGVCMKVVNEYGTQQYNTPKRSCSIGGNTSEG